MLVLHKFLTLCLCLSLGQWPIYNLLTQGPFSWKGIYDFVFPSYLIISLMRARVRSLAAFEPQFVSMSSIGTKLNTIAVITLKKIVSCLGKNVLIALQKCKLNKKKNVAITLDSWLDIKHWLHQRLCNNIS